jgi:hypothetical protein
MHHLFHAVEELWDIYALNGGRNHSEIRKRGIAPADARKTKIGMAESVAFGDFLEVRAWIGDRDEPLSGAL